MQPYVSPPRIHPRRIHRSEQELQAIDIQRLVFMAVIDPDLPLKQRLEATKVWELVTERRRILAGKPLPGAFKPEKPAKAAPVPKRKANWRDAAATVLATAARQEQPANAPTLPSDAPQSPDHPNTPPHP